MECGMKEWQRGYDLEYLKSLENRFSDYNQYSLSPFAKFKKNDIADSLHNNELVVLEDSMYEIKVSKQSSHISMHGDTLIATKKKGDITLGKLSGNLEKIKQDFNKIVGNKWLFVWAENREHTKFAEDTGFSYVGPKITSFGEIYSVYYQGEERSKIEVDRAEYLSIKRIGLFNTESIFKKLTQLPEFKNHYSNYNIGNSWSALSLRGYTDDPTFIENPVEMNKKWKEANKARSFGLTDTKLYDIFPEVREFCASLGSEIHRVRFMRLTSNGKLDRHTDQVDPDSGGAIGKLARLHLPIKTNESARFYVWGVDGMKQEVHMASGEVWFIDTRKPHMAVNGGSTERIHLVIDVRVDQTLHSKLLSS